MPWEPSPEAGGALMTGGSRVPTADADNWDSFCSNASSNSSASPAASVFLAGRASPAQVAALSCEASPATSLRRRSQRAADSSARMTVGLVVFGAPRIFPFPRVCGVSARQCPGYRRRHEDVGRLKIILAGDANQREERIAAGLGGRPAPPGGGGKFPGGPHPPG